MPRFHAGFSLGHDRLGAGLGVLVAAVAVPMLVHLVVLAVAVAGARCRAGHPPLPGRSRRPREPPPRRPRSAWLEPRTLAVGVMVLAFAVAEGTANDWLSLALIDGYGVASTGSAWPASRCS